MKIGHSWSDAALSGLQGVLQTAYNAARQLNARGIPLKVEALRMWLCERAPGEPAEDIDTVVGFVQECMVQTGLFRYDPESRGYWLVPLTAGNAGNATSSLN